MIEPCTLKRLSFIGWLEWLENSRHITCYIIETHTKPRNAGTLITKYK